MSSIAERYSSCRSVAVCFFKLYQFLLSPSCQPLPNPSRRAHRGSDHRGDAQGQGAAYEALSADIVVAPGPDTLNVRIVPYGPETQVRLLDCPVTFA